MKSPLNFLLSVLFLVGGLWPVNFPASSQSLIYRSPAPGARYTSPTTSIAIRQGKPLNPTSIENGILVITGNQSGVHAGRMQLSDDALTLLFYPDRPFTLGETVTVQLQPGLALANGSPVQTTGWQFEIIDRSLDVLARPPSLESEFAAEPESPGAPLASSQFHTWPELTGVMTTTVVTPAQGTADGLIFVTAMGLLYNGDRAPMILDDLGEPVFIHKTPDDLFVTDFKHQNVGGTPYLTYHLGVPDRAWSNGGFYILDDSYTVVDYWTIGNGYGADEHDLQLLEDGHALLFSYTPIPYDLSPYGGPTDGTVMDIVLQEQDADKNVVFEWHASQHIPITDTLVALDRSPVDYVHTNAVEPDQDGNLLISNRNISEITKIDRQTGEIIWRLGGKSNQYTFTNDIGFHNQHDIRRLDNGHITLFDNGNDHVPPHSRAIEYAIDETNFMITRTWQYPEDTSEYSFIMANSQLLENDNRFIGWGGQPKLSEVHPDGTVALEMLLGTLSYRAFRFPWSATPAEPPRAIVYSPGEPEAAMLFASWNGATEVSDYQVYAGPDVDHMDLVTTTLRTGFETAISLAGLPPGHCVYQVQPVRPAPLEMPMSNLTYRTDLESCRELLTFTYLPLVIQ